MSAETDNPGGAAGAVSMDDVAAPATEPTPTVAHDQQTTSHPAGSAAPESGIPTTERPEVLVGAAFAGGLVAAKILKRLGR